MPNLVALSLMVSDKNIFKDLNFFKFSCHGNQSFLAPLAVGQRAYFMVRCPSCVRLSVRAFTFSLNIFLSETTNRILKFHRNVLALVLFTFLERI